MGAYFTIKEADLWAETRGLSLNLLRLFENLAFVHCSTQSARRFELVFANQALMIQGSAQCRVCTQVCPQCVALWLD